MPNRTLAGALCLSLLAGGAIAQTSTRKFDIPSQSLAQALRDYGRATDRQLIFTEDLVRGRTAPALAGPLTPDAALDRLLAGSDLAWRRSASGGIMIVRREAALPQSAAAAENAGPDASMLGEVVVTGSRIAGSGPVGSKTVSIERVEIVSSGRSSAADLVRLLPQNVSIGASEETRGSIQASQPNSGYGVGPNLRGLGLDATLSMVNGHRIAQANYGGFVDISQIPLVAVERVEVLVDGASAIYGSDAVGGVVNFILRSDFEGAETSLRAGGGDGFEDYMISQAFGRRWASGSAFVAVEYRDRSSLAASDRAYFTDDLRAFGGPDLRRANASPGNITFGGVTYGIPRGQNGVGLSAGQLLPGSPNRDNRWELADILPSIKKLSGAATFRQDLTPDLTFKLDMLASRRESVRLADMVFSTLTVPRSNPFFVSPSPTAQTTTVLYSFNGDFGPQAAETVSEDVTVSAAFEARLPGDWDITLEATSSRNRVDFFYDEAINSTALALALADSNPATAFNPFGDRGSNSAAAIERIRGFFQADTALSYRTLGVEATGPLFRLPAGQVKVALGAETRRERFTYFESRLTSGVTPAITAYAPDRRIDAAYAEALVPLVGAENALPGVRELDLSLAVRGERYLDTGKDLNPKVGVAWRPTDSLKLSASWGTSFKAPSLYQKSTAANTIGVTSISVPGAPGGTGQIILLSGVQAGLQPEEAETWTVGGEYRPAWAPGLKISVGYFDVAYENRILRPTSAEISAALASGAASPIIVRRAPTAGEVAAYYADPLFSPNSVRPPAAQILAVVDFRAANLGLVEQSGFDFGVEYDFDTELGRFRLSADAAYVERYAVARLAGQTAVDLRNTTSNPIDLRGRVGLAWSRGPWAAAATAYYTGDYRNTTVTPFQKVPSWTTVDTHLAYAAGREAGWLSGVTLAFDVRNLLDEDPPAVANVGGAFGYDSEQATALGRALSVSLTKRW